MGGWVHRSLVGADGGGGREELFYLAAMLASSKRVVGWGRFDTAMCYLYSSFGGMFTCSDHLVGQVHAGDT
jgi:hypothetical protein